MTPAATPDHWFLHSIQSSHDRPSTSVVAGRDSLALATIDRVELTVPDPALVLLIGPSGAGKSTFAARHFASTEIISSDALRAMLADDPADQQASAEAFRVLSILANGRLKRRLTTVIDATNLRAANRKAFSRLAARYGIPVVAVAFDFADGRYAANNLRRLDRVVEDHVVADQAQRMRATMALLAAEGYAALCAFREPQEAAAATIARRSADSQPVRSRH